MDLEYWKYKKGTLFGSEKLSSQDRLELLKSRPNAIMWWPSSTQAEQTLVIKQDCNLLDHIRNPTSKTRLMAITDCPATVIHLTGNNIATDFEIFTAISRKPFLIADFTDHFSAKWLALGMLLLKNDVHRRHFNRIDQWDRAIDAVDQWAPYWKHLLNIK